MAFPLRFGVLRALAKEVSVSGEAGKPLVVGGARELATVLRRELARDATGVRADDTPDGAALLVYVLAGEPTPGDEAALKRARRARVPVVLVATGPVADDVSLPFVLATDVVRVAPGEGFPLEAIADVVARRLGEDAAPLAARVPVLRGAVARELVATFARRNGVTGAAVFVGGADLPVMALHQARLLLRLEQAYGRSTDLQERAPELAATLLAGLGLRALARELVALVPGARWAVQGAVAYAGTRALGEAVVLRLEAAPGRH
ncbi:MAG TPA: hypothetical protein VFA56_06520 [Gaiellaceae bacterium]|nr:hypothetical protein [Gaiellaceae bacterium]